MIERYEPADRNYHYIKVTFAHASYFGCVVIKVGGNCKGASVLSEGLDFWENCDIEDVQNLVSKNCELELYEGQADEFWFRLTLIDSDNGDKMQFDELDYEELTDMIVGVEFVEVEPEEDSE